MATEMHASVDTIIRIQVEIDRNSIKYELDILNNVLIRTNMESVCYFYMNLILLLAMLYTAALEQRVAVTGTRVSLT